MRNLNFLFVLGIVVLFVACDTASPESVDTPESVDNTETAQLTEIPPATATQAAEESSQDNDLVDSMPSAEESSQNNEDDLVDIALSSTRAAEELLRYNALASIAPSGTVIEAEAPGRGHDDTLTHPFGELPPKGGTHHSQWQKCQVYKQPILTQHAIHTMEHGAVWVTYQPELDEEIVTRIELFGLGNPFVLTSPYPNQRTPIVLTAWGLQLEVDSLDDQRIEVFISAFANGIQSPEPGATCTSGLETLAVQ